MSSIHLTHNGTDVSAYIGKVETTIGRGIEKGVGKVTLFIERESAVEAPADTGRLRGGITSTLRESTGTIFSTSHYAKFVHEGTRPHRVGADKLMGWAKRKGLNPYAVANSIRKKGTKANPFFVRALEKNKMKALEIFSSEIDKAISSVK